MAKQFFLLNVTILAAMAMAVCAKRKTESLMSTFTEKSFQSDKACIDQFNDKLSQYLQQIEGPQKANTSLIHRIGKEAEEIINKRVNDMIWYCNGTSIEVSPYIVTHLRKNGRNFYVEQLAIQRIVIKPILNLDQIDISTIEIIRARNNETSREKLKMEMANQLQSELLNDLALQISNLQEKLRNVTAERDVYRTIGQERAKAFEDAAKLLEIENNKYDQVKVLFDYITANACGCQKCRPNQVPNWNDFLATREPS